MPQSNAIFFFLFAAFFVYITIRGELPKYMGFLLASPSTGGSVAIRSSANSIGTLSSDLSNPAVIGTLF